MDPAWPAMEDPTPSIVAIAWMAPDRPAAPHDTMHGWDSLKSTPKKKKKTLNPKTHEFVGHPLPPGK